MLILEILLAVYLIIGITCACTVDKISEFNNNKLLRVFIFIATTTLWLPAMIFYKYTNWQL
jgi:hypothetical protein